MSRTYRDSHRIHVNQWWNKWYTLYPSYNWRNWGRDALQELTKIGGWTQGHGYYKGEWRREANQRERALIHMSLKHGGLYWYYRRKHGDGYWD